MFEMFERGVMGRHGASWGSRPLVAKSLWGPSHLKESQGAVSHGGVTKTAHSRKPLSVRLEYTRNCIVAQVCIEWYPARVCI